MVAESSPRILIVDDDPAVRDALRLTLEPLHESAEAADGVDGIRAFHRYRPDLVIADVATPRLDGFELLRRIRELGDTPVILLADDPAAADTVRGLRAGADDYVLKPIDAEAVAARVEAVLRRAISGRSRPPARVELDQGQLVVDTGRAEVWLRGERIALSATEYRLLAYLVRHADRVVSPAEILTHIWGAEYANELGYVKSYVRLVRRKIETNPQAPRYLVSRRGLGYTLVSEPPER